MGDRTYARISIPQHGLTTPTVRQVVADILQTTSTALDEVLATTPALDDAAYEDGVSLRLVEQVSCMVWEQFESNYGASSEELALVAAGIPFLLIHSDGGEYSGGSVVFDGTRRADVHLNRQDQIVAVVDTETDRACIHPAVLAEIDSYLEIKRALLKP